MVAGHFNADNARPRALQRSVIYIVSSRGMR
jgi:hypothetical protein